MDFNLCGTSDLIEPQFHPGCKWSRSPVTIHQYFEIPRSPIVKAGPIQSFSILQWWVQEWNAVCGINLALTNGPADITYLVGNQSNGVGCYPNAALAVSNYPCITQKILIYVAPCRIWGDWVNPKTGKPEKRWNDIRALQILHNALGHELGHAIGIPHPPNNINAVMNINGTINTLQAWDINQAQIRYGQPQHTKQPRPGLPYYYQPIINWEPIVQKMYQELLGREADKGGLNHWIGLLKNGAEWSLITALIATSNEFINRCKRLYPTVSDEHQLLIHGWYKWMDNKDKEQIDQPGFDHWLRQINLTGRIPTAQIFAKVSKIKSKLGIN